VLESEIFGAESPPLAIAIHGLLRHCRASMSGRGRGWRWPLHLLARHQVSNETLSAGPVAPAGRRVLQDFARDLLPRLESTQGGCFWRRWCSAKDASLLRHWSSSDLRAAGPGPLGMLLTTWRAARNADAPRRPAA
jgi:hypothetical protein